MLSFLGLLKENNVKESLEFQSKLFLKVETMKESFEKLKELSRLESIKHCTVKEDIDKNEVENKLKELKHIILYKEHLRIKILNSNGFDYANQQIELFHSNGKTENLLSFKALSFWSICNKQSLYFLYGVKFSVKVFI